MINHHLRHAARVGVIREASTGKYTVQAFDYADLFRDFPTLAETRHEICYRVVVVEYGFLYETSRYPRQAAKIGARMVDEINQEISKTCPAMPHTQPRQSTS